MMGIISVLTARCAATAQVITCGSQYSSASVYQFQIKSCAFSSLTSSTNGGAICISSASSTFTSLKSTFSNCTATGTAAHGGAIYDFSASFCISSCCCSKSSAYVGHFFYIVQTGVSFVNDSSTFQCPSSYKSSQNQAISTRNGTVYARSINNSFSVNYGNGAAFVLSSDSSAMFFQVFNNSAFSSIIHFDAQSFTQNVSYTNIIHNYAIDPDMGSILLIVLTYSDTSINVHECVFYGNTAPYMIYYYGSSGNADIGNCYFDSNTYTTIQVSGTYMKTYSIGSVKTFGFQIHMLNLSGISCIYPQSITDSFTPNVATSNLFLLPFLFLQTLLI